MYVIGPQSDWGGLYQHTFVNTSEDELAKWFRYLLQDGVSVEGHFGYYLFCLNMHEKEVCAIINPARLE